GPGASRSVRVRFRADPVVDDRASEGWVSMTLSTSVASTGWVTLDDAVVGVLVRSNGQIEVFSRGVERAPRFDGPTPAPADVYSVELEIAGWGATPTLRGTINEATFTMPLADASARPW